MDLLAILQSVRARPWIGYGAAVALPLSASVLRSALVSVMVGPYVAFFVVVLFVALIGTRGAATLSTILSAFLASRFVPDSAGSIVPQTLTGWLSFSTFLIVCGIVIYLTNALSETLVRLTRAHEELTALNQKLYLCVHERTNALRSTEHLLVMETNAKAKAEEQARHSQKMETIGLLTGGIAHDFNNMLSIIVGSLELIRRRVDNGSTDISHHLENAMDGAKRSAALTQRLLAISRKQPLTPSVIDISDRIEGMAELLTRTLGSNIVVRVIKGLNISNIKADVSQFENAILNLAINARDAMPSGGILTIETSQAHVDDVRAEHGQNNKGQYVVIAVSDTGIGMSDDVISRAFEPFFTTKPTGEGTGLGLSQIYGFVKQSGGHVKIDSTLGNGTTIKLYLPGHTATATPEM